MNSCILWNPNEIWKWADGSLVVGQKTEIIPKPEVMYCLIPLVWKIQANPHRRTLANRNHYATRKHSGQIPRDWIHVKAPLWMLATFPTYLSTTSTEHNRPGMSSVLDHSRNKFVIFINRWGSCWHLLVRRNRLRSVSNPTGAGNVGWGEAHPLPRWIINDRDKPVSQ